MPERARIGESGRRPPVRTCVGCRSRAAQSDLVRLVADGALVTPDPDRRAPGRGAYLHPDPACRASAERRGAWQRAFRVRARLDASRVAAYFSGGPRVGDGDRSG
ncbi:MULTISPECIES: YlxR family protein [Nocardiopsis]|uniref:YlxR family protein n=1 Tax=Nocardiopsis TaxID=2013 RepID=UPI0006874596|nr:MULTISPECIES: YlxR family protein [Nocardiopsis]